MTKIKIKKYGLAIKTAEKKKKKKKKEVGERSCGGPARGGDKWCRPLWPSVNANAVGRVVPCLPWPGCNVRTVG